MVIQGHIFVTVPRSRFQMILIKSSDLFLKILRISHYAYFLKKYKLHKVRATCIAKIWKTIYFCFNFAKVWKHEKSSIWPYFENFSFFTKIEKSSNLNKSTKIRGLQFLLRIIFVVLCCVSQSKADLYRVLEMKQRAYLLLNSVNEVVLYFIVSD